MTHLLFNDIWTDGKFDGFEKEIAMTRGVRPKNRASKSKSKNYFYLFRFEIFMYVYASRENNF